MNKKRLIAINFDLDTKKLKDIYVSSTGKKYNRAYYDIKAFMKKNGFSHRQGSGYISKEPMTEMAATLIMKKMGNLMPWLKDCTKKIDLTIVGNQFDLTDILNTKSNSAPKQNKNVIDKSVTSDKNNTSNEKSNANFKEKYDALNKKYNELAKSYGDLLEANIKKEDVINTTNQIFKQNPQLTKEFKAAKEKFLHQKTEGEKSKGSLSDNELSEYKPKQHKQKR